MYYCRIRFVQRYIIIIPIIIILSVTCYAQTFEKLKKRLEEDILDFKNEVERLYRENDPCVALSGCSEANYHACISQLPPSVECIPTERMDQTSKCSNFSSSCSIYYDFSSSVVSVPKQLLDTSTNNPVDPLVTQSICFSRLLDTWFQEKWKNNTIYYNEHFHGMQPSNMYYGSQHGSFRIYPALGLDDCGGFDPRVRPWYAAASTGPKNVILILDTSTDSMQGSRLDMLKKATKLLVKSLSIADRVGLIVMSSSNVLEISDNDRTLYSATMKTIENIIQKINNLQATAGGAANFQTAFQMAFDLLHRTAENDVYEDYKPPNNTAILFFTSSKITNPPNATDVINLVDNGIKENQRIRKKPIFLFTYSISEDDDADVGYSFPSKLACSVQNGIWSNIAIPNNTSPDDIFKSLSTFYQLFASGMGGEENYVAWTDPDGYTFITTGAKGTAVSAPVFDHDKNPPLLLGVVGMNFALKSMTAALGNSTQTEMDIGNLVYGVQQRSPTINLSSDEIQLYRCRGSVNSKTPCNKTCTKQNSRQEQYCTRRDHPRNLWHNIDTNNINYFERVCCSTDPSEEEQCTYEDQQKINNKNIYIGAISGGILLIVVMIMFFLYRRRQKAKQILQHSRLAIISPNYNAPFNTSHTANHFETPDTVNHLSPPVHNSNATAHFESVPTGSPNHQFSSSYIGNNVALTVYPPFVLHPSVPVVPEEKLSTNNK